MTKILSLPFMGWLKIVWTWALDTKALSYIFCKILLVGFSHDDHVMFSLFSHAWLCCLYTRLLISKWQLKFFSFFFLLIHGNIHPAGMIEGFYIGISGDWWIGQTNKCGTESVRSQLCGHKGKCCTALSRSAKNTDFTSIRGWKTWTWHCGPTRTVRPDEQRHVGTPSICGHGMEDWTTWAVLGYRHFFSSPVSRHFMTLLKPVIIINWGLLWLFARSLLWSKISPGSPDMCK